MLQLQEQARQAGVLAEEVGQSAEETVDDKDTISIYADRMTHLVKLSNIVYLESAGEYVRLHLSDGTKLVTLFRLKNMENSLQAGRFMRVHRSYIINLDQVLGYTKGRVFLSNDDYVPIGESYKEAFLRYTNEKM